MDPETGLADEPALLSEEDQAKNTLIDDLFPLDTTPDPDVLAQVLWKLRQLQDGHTNELCQALQSLADRSRWGQQRDCSSTSVD